MIKLKEMNKSIFYDNLMLTINEIMGDIRLDDKSVRFKIIPVYEKDKSFNGLDNQMRLIALSEKNGGNRLLSVEETVNLVACQSPFVPIWINISLNEISEHQIIFNFETSLRFRKPSQLRNVETGHPPFKAIMQKWGGSVKNFVNLVKNSSFLVRITDMTILIEKGFIYGSKRPNEGVKFSVSMGKNLLW